LDRAVDKTISLIEEAASNGAGLVAFPETFIRVTRGTSGWDLRLDKLEAA